MHSTLKYAGAAVLALAVASPALAASPTQMKTYGDNAKAPAATYSGNPTKTKSEGGSGIQSSKQAQKATNTYHKREQAAGTQSSPNGAAVGTPTPNTGASR